MHNARMRHRNMVENPSRKSSAINRKICRIQFDLDFNFYSDYGVCLAFVSFVVLLHSSLVYVFVCDGGWWMVVVPMCRRQWHQHSLVVVVIIVFVSSCALSTIRVQRKCAETISSEIVNSIVWSSSGTHAHTAEHTWAIVTKLLIPLFEFH